MARIVRPSKRVRRGVVEKARLAEGRASTLAQADTSPKTLPEEGTGEDANYNAHPLALLQGWASDLRKPKIQTVRRTGSCVACSLAPSK
jgi:hypothetical protein